MRFEQLYYVKAIAKCHSLSQAARALHLNQPTLSRALANFEEELGGQLFHRDHQGMVLTDLGNRVLPYFERIMIEMEAAQMLISAEKTKDISGTLTISASSVLCNDFLLNVIAAFNQCYPLINVDIIRNLQWTLSDVFIKMKLIWALFHLIKPLKRCYFNNWINMS